MRPYTRVYASVNLDAVESNMKAMAGNLAEGVAIMGVVKTDGYGHGAVPVAKTIDPYVMAYGVSTIEEAVNLRHHGIQ
jgi:alanine racemase